MKKRIVIALGGNAILETDPNEKGQIDTIRKTVKSIMSLNPSENELIITHGNGPQVGNLLLQQIYGSSEKNPPLSLNTCVAMTQGEIGNWLQNELTNELIDSEISKNVVVVPTRVIVDSSDTAFENPEKPIGPYYEECPGENSSEIHYKLFKDRGWRRVVASPKPVEIMEINAIEELISKGYIVICGGGGGTAYIRKDGSNRLMPTDCVIDKDLVAEKIASFLRADILIILTGVCNVYLNYGQSDERVLERISVSTLKKYINEGFFEAGTILPKVKAAVSFVEKNPTSKAVITSLESIKEIGEREVGTIVTSDI